MRTNRKNNLKIVATCSVAIFSLLAVCSGVYAWFTVLMAQTATTDQFAVVNIGSCDLYAVDLIKFDYHSTTYNFGDDEFTVVDYLTPETGEVNSYAYDKDRQSFGYLDGSTWVPVTKMNTYDPVDLLIYGGDVIDLNCNAIYKFTVFSSDLTNVDFSAMAKIAETRIKEENELFLSDCCDIDVFWTTDLLDSNPVFSGDDPSTPETETNYKTYYPTYINQSATLTSLEDVYYKISYLASLKSSHAHFYGGSEEEISLLTDSKRLTFTYDSTLDGNIVTFYVNVNYSPEQLEPYKTKIYSTNINVIFDFGFRFYFSRAEE